MGAFSRSEQAGHCKQATRSMVAAAGRGAERLPREAVSYPSKTAYEVADGPAHGVHVRAGRAAR